MQLYVLTDIWGKTKSLEQWVAKLSHALPTVNQVVLSPYDTLQSSENVHFKSEQHAYQYFSDNVGLEAYCEYVRSQLLTTIEPVIVVGFSAGGSAIWRLSEDKSIAKKVNQAFCFYSSQVRHSLILVPNFPVTYIAPASEPGFDITDITDILRQKDNVEVEQTPYLHGFMNARSINFNPQGLTQFTSKIETCIQQVQG
ncbi:MAG: hypothetical protein HWE10_03540 [Gammaproteobacteria bacterium]|nr:hypothetical protein [Gammaproteobacteria bacterium]